MSTATRKSKRVRGQRLVVSVTAAQTTLIEHAAMLQGRTITDFTLATVLDAARRTIEERRQITLSVRDIKTFVAALLDPKPVNAPLRDTVRRYRDADGA